MKRGVNGAYDWRQTVSDTRGRITQHGEKPHRFFSGTVATPLGYVVVYSQGSMDDSRPLSIYRAIVDGVEYALNERVARTERGLAIMARKFIERLYDEVQS